MSCDDDENPDEDDAIPLRLVPVRREYGDVDPVTDYDGRNDKALNA
jgi:hypothetical protein